MLGRGSGVIIIFALGGGLVVRMGVGVGVGGGAVRRGGSIGTEPRHVCRIF